MAAGSRGLAAATSKKLQIKRFSEKLKIFNKNGKSNNRSVVEFKYCKKLQQHIHTLELIMAKAKMVAVLDESSVDRLGMLLAQIADLTEQADAIKDAIKDSGKTIEGTFFKATYSESDRKSFDKELFIKAHG